jgi:membrane dipeptidase
MSTTSPLPVFDGHNDTLLRLYRKGPGSERLFFTPGEEGHIDLPRARAGGFGGGFFAVFVPPEAGESVPSSIEPYRTAKGGYLIPLPEPLDPAYAERTARAMAALLFRLEAMSRWCARRTKWRRACRKGCWPRSCISRAPSRLPPISATWPTSMN